jgi:uncharacterized membrane protein YcaP (DUF421 family)
MNKIAKPLDLPLVVIHDGRLLEENLIKAGVDKTWLMNNLAMYRIDHIDDVYLATIDISKRLYLSKK